MILGLRKFCGARAGFALLGFLVACSGCSSGNAPPGGNSPIPPPGNSPPTISGGPTTNLFVGNAWSFTPSASDPDGDILTFSIQNQPGWTDFDIDNGTLSGTPQMGDVGTYANIVITVSDGTAASSLPAFTATVAVSGTGSVTLDWIPPSLNSDGTSLTDLVAYKFYYGTAPDNLDNQVRVNNAGLSSYVIDNLFPDTYYFAATVVNSNEVESDRSNIATATVPTSR
jgi:hypothetical protein